MRFGNTKLRVQVRCAQELLHLDNKSPSKGGCGPAGRLHCRGLPGGRMPTHAAARAGRCSQCTYVYRMYSSQSNAEQQANMLQKRWHLAKQELLGQPR